MKVLLIKVIRRTPVAILKEIGGDRVMGEELQEAR